MSVTDDSEKPSVRKFLDMPLRTSQDLCKMAEMLGYGDRFGQLQNENGSFVSSLLNFFDDNPGAMAAVMDWAVDNHDLPDEEEPDDEPMPEVLKL